MSEVRVRKKIGASAGLILRNDGGDAMFVGSSRAVAAIAELTSCAAASISRSSANWMVIAVMPWLLSEVIESMPAMVENCFSSTVATAAAIVSGFAPDNSAVTWIVGKSTLGSDETGSFLKPAMPNTTMPSMTSMVITGRRMNSSEIFAPIDFYLRIFPGRLSRREQAAIGRV